LRCYEANGPTRMVERMDTSLRAAPPLIAKGVGPTYIALAACIAKAQECGMAVWF